MKVDLMQFEGAVVSAKAAPGSKDASKTSEFAALLGQALGLKENQENLPPVPLDGAEEPLSAEESFSEAPLKGEHSSSEEAEKEKEVTAGTLGFAAGTLAEAERGSTLSVLPGSKEGGPAENSAGFSEAPEESLRGTKEAFLSADASKVLTKSATEKAEAETFFKAQSALASEEANATGNLALSAEVPLEGFGEALAEAAGEELLFTGPGEGVPQEGTFLKEEPSGQVPAQDEAVLNLVAEETLAKTESAIATGGHGEQQESTPLVSPALAAASSEHEQAAEDGAFDPGQKQAAAVKPAASHTDTPPPVSPEPGSLAAQVQESKPSFLPGQDGAALRQNVLDQLEGKLVYLRERASFPAEMRFTVNPPELGEVTIRVFSRQGKLSATIMAQSQLVKEVIESSVYALRQKMNFGSIQFEQLDVFTSSGEAQNPKGGGAGDNFSPQESFARTGTGQGAAKDTGTLRTTSETHVLVDYLA